MFELPLSPLEWKEAIERWKKFRKKKIRITVIENVKQEGSIFNILKKVSEGTIDSVFELPPGIMLNHVTERWVREIVWGNMTNSGETSSRAKESTVGNIKESTKRFIPFKELGTIDFIG